VVKAVQRLANVRACLADRKRSMLAHYRSEHPVFRQAAYQVGLIGLLPGLQSQLLSFIAELNSGFSKTILAFGKLLSQLAPYNQFKNLEVTNWNVYSSALACSGKRCATTEAISSAK
jgi:hypothetical protein